MYVNKNKTQTQSNKPRNKYINFDHEVIEIIDERIREYEEKKEVLSHLNLNEEVTWLLLLLFIVIIIYCYF